MIAASLAPAPSSRIGVPALSLRRMYTEIMVFDVGEVPSLILQATYRPTYKFDVLSTSVDCLADPLPRLARVMVSAEAAAKLSLSVAILRV